MNRQAMPKPNMIPEGDDIVNQILTALQANGDMPAEEWRRLVLLAMGHLISHQKILEASTIQGLFKAKPIQFIAVLTIIFVVLHEFATYINIGILLRAAGKALGVPIP
jgi:hypothetical protein